MAKHSNHVSWDSVDGNPVNPYPMIPVKVACKNEDCAEEIDTEICPYCGAKNEIEFEVDYEAGDSEREDD